jgi:2'-5' RNA ligase
MGKSLPSSAYSKGDKVVALTGVGPQSGEVIVVQGGKIKIRPKNGPSIWMPPSMVSKLEESVFLQEADSHHTGVMVALYPHPSTARKFALDGGEDPDALHCTLAFLGHKDDLPDHQKLKDTVKDWASRTAPLHGEVSGHGVFTAGETPVTYLSPDLPGLPAARQDLIDSLGKAGIKHNDEHGYSPHMTLDYADRSSDLPNHGGHKLAFRRAVVKIGDEKTSYPFGGERTLRENWSTWDQERGREKSLAAAPDAAAGNRPWRRRSFGKGLFVPRTGRTHIWRTDDGEDSAPWHQHVLDELVKRGEVKPGEPVHGVEIDPQGWVAYSSLMTDAGKVHDAPEDEAVRAQVFKSRSPEQRAVQEKFVEKLPALKAYPPMKTPPTGGKSA